jgi:hypothetical protein
MRPSKRLFHDSGLVRQAVLVVHHLEELVALPVRR